MSRLALHKRIKRFTRPGLALALAAAVAVGLAVGPSLTYQHIRLPQTVQLGTSQLGGSGSGMAAGGAGSGSPSPTPADVAHPQPTEPVETVNPPGTVVSLPSQDSGGGDQQKSSLCSSTSESNQSCKKSGGG